LEIQIADGQNLEKALRQFRRKVQRAGILADMRRKRHYEKPSEAKRRKQKAAQRRLARNARRRKQRS
jgi:small subunit ribosomal protein S21